MENVYEVSWRKNRKTHRRVVRESELAIHLTEIQNLGVKPKLDLIIKGDE